jgi:hypothetical protein
LGNDCPVAFLAVPSDFSIRHDTALTPLLAYASSDGFSTVAGVGMERRFPKNFLRPRLARSLALQKAHNEMV